MCSLKITSILTLSFLCIRRSLRFWSDAYFCLLLVSSFFLFRPLQIVTCFFVSELFVYNKLFKLQSNLCSAFLLNYALSSCELKPPWNTNTSPFSSLKPCGDDIRYQVLPHFRVLITNFIQQTAGSSWCSSKNYFPIQNSNFCFR